MCNPALAVMAVTTVASMATTGLSIRSQNQAAEAQAESANEAATLDMQQLLTRGQELSEQTTREKLQRQIQTERYRGRLRAVMADTGISGQSSLNILNQAMLQESYDLGVLDSNQASGLSQTRASLESIAARNRSRINQAEANTVNGLMSGLMIGQAGLSGAMQGYSMGKGISGLMPSSIKTPKGIPHKTSMKSATIKVKG